MIIEATKKDGTKKLFKLEINNITYGKECPNGYEICAILGCTCKDEE